jgi:hypothetical protein
MLLATVALFGVSRAATRGSGPLTQLANQAQQATANLDSLSVRPSLSAPTITDLRQDIARLELLRSHNLDELIQTADELERKWHGATGDLYALMMVHVCSEISNRGLNDVRVRFQSERFSLTALSNPTFTVEREWELLSYLQEDLNPENSKDWLKERSEKAKLWLHGWRRLEKETDPRFNIRDRPFLNIAPPAETQLPAGVAPEAIKDAKLRAEYTAAIAANAEKARRYNQQYILRRDGPAFINEAKKYLVRAYSKPPQNTDELRRYLTTYITNTTARRTLLNEVRKNVQSDRQP